MIVLKIAFLRVENRFFKSLYILTLGTLTLEITNGNKYYNLFFLYGVVFFKIEKRTSVGNTLITFPTLFSTYKVLV